MGTFTKSPNPLLNKIMDLKPVFEYGKAVCKICGTPLGEPNIYWIGDDAYCAEHYQKEGFAEKPKNWRCYIVLWRVGFRV